MVVPVLAELSEAHQSGTVTFIDRSDGDQRKVDGGRGSDGA